MAISLIRQVRPRDRIRNIGVGNIETGEKDFCTFNVSP